MGTGNHYSRVLRIVLPLLLSAGVVYVLFLYPAPQSEPLADDDEVLDRLTIRWLEPVNVHPGGAVLAELSGLEPQGELTARYSAGQAKRPVEVLRVDGPRATLLIPNDADPGPVKLRVYQNGKKSKPRFLQVQPLAVADTARDVLGGLALLVVGLGLLSRAFRQYAGQRLRLQLTRLTANQGRSVGLGMVLGALTQATTSAAGILTGLLQARLLRERSVLGVVLGVQLGASTAGALLPLFASRHALWIIVLGLVWVVAAADRKARARANQLLGCGLILLGLAFMQQGFRPLLSEPALLPYLAHLSADGPLATLGVFGIGALLAALLQGPGPAFAIVASLGESTLALSLPHGLTLLAGAALGCVSGAAVVGCAAGPHGRRLVMAQLWVGICLSVVALIGLPLWAAVAQWVTPTGIALADGSRALRPYIAGQLSAGFLVSQLCGGLLVFSLLPLLQGWLDRIPQPRVTPAETQHEGLVPVLSACRNAVLALGEVVVTRDREPAVVAERAIAEARSAVAGLLGGLPASAEGGAVDLATATACLHLASATDSALRVAERALERDLHIDQAAAEHLARAHALLVEGVEGLVNHAAGRSHLDLEEVQVREIRLNALEAQARGANMAEEPLAERLWISELSSALEGMGNHIYRLAKALAEQPVVRS